jgi:hypothetical protein
MLSELLGQIFAPVSVGLHGMKLLAPSIIAEKVTSNNLKTHTAGPTTHPIRRSPEFLAMLKARIDAADRGTHRYTLVETRQALQSSVKRASR